MHLRNQAFGKRCQSPKMGVEINMAKQPFQGNSTRILHPAASHRSQPNLITVKDAARRLGVSKSTVYRIDRNDGPFRFVVDSRRIFIESASFETFLANTGRNGTESELTANDVSIDSIQGEQPERTPSQIDAMPVEPPRPSPFRDVPHTISSSGQRENILPRSHAVGFLYYQTLMG
jgi:hypothetical protein